MTAVLEDIWSVALESIRLAVGEGRYHLWFRQTELITQDQGVYQVGVPNRFVADWLDEHLKETVERCLSDNVSELAGVRFVVSPKLFQESRAAQTTAQQELLDELPTEKPRPTTDEYHDYTLDSFVVGHCNRMAYAAARHVADGIDTELNPLFIHGAVGLGKTHLLRGICAKVNASNRRAYYTSGESFTNQFVASLQHRTLDAFRARFRNVDVLAIDDVHFLANKKATQEEFLHTYDFLSRLNKQIILASDAHPRALASVMTELTNRMSSGMIVRLEAPEYETRLALLRHKLRMCPAALPEDVLAHVAQSVEGNMRELQGAATTLLAMARLLGRKVDVPTAREALKSLKARQQQVTLRDVEREVCDKFDVSPEQLTSSNRSKSLATPRHVAMYVARELTEHSWQEIGVHFNRKNHSAAIFAHKKITKKMGSEPTFSDRVREIISRLKNPS